MHNTIPLTIVLVLTSVSASAQFYTITRETEIIAKPIVKIVETSEIKEDSVNKLDSIHPLAIESENEEKLGQKILNDRKSDDYKSLQSLPTRGGVAPDNNALPELSLATCEEGSSLPELTIPNLLAEIEKNGIKYPKIVLAQAILETGWFKSSVCRNKHNLFGLTNPRTGKYYEFNHWTESVKAYYTKVQYRYKGGNYLLWLDKIGYAEEKTYVRALIRVLKQL